jgi:hypothetical protein
MSETRDITWTRVTFMDATGIEGVHVRFVEDDLVQPCCLGV